MKTTSRAKPPKQHRNPYVAAVSRNPVLAALVKELRPDVVVLNEGEDVGENINGVAEWARKTMRSGNGLLVACTRPISGLGVGKDLTGIPGIAMRDTKPEKDRSAFAFVVTPILLVGSDALMGFTQHMEFGSAVSAKAISSQNNETLVRKVLERSGHKHPDEHDIAVAVANIQETTRRHILHVLRAVRSCHKPVSQESENARTG